jgi:hypothetical protein
MAVMSMAHLMWSRPFFRTAASGLIGLASGVATVKNPVLQASMATGEVELF